MKADGSLLMPNPETWQIVNNGSGPVTITDIATSDITDDVTSISMQTGDEWQFDDPSNTPGHWNFAYMDGNDFLTKTAGTVDNPLVISKGYPLNCAWNVEVTDSAKRSATGTERRIGNVSISFKAIEKTTFAVYNNENRTLDFYKRLNLPKIGDTFDGKRVDEIFPIDTENGYHQKYTANGNAGTNISVPWHELMNNSMIDTVTVRDVISPRSVSWWFMNGYMQTLDLTNLDMSRCIDAQRMFSSNNSIVTLIGLDTWDTSSLENAYAMFDGFFSRLTDISFCKNWNMSKVRHIGGMFYNTNSFETADFSNWDLLSVDTNSTADDGHTGGTSIFGYTEIGYWKIRNINISKSAARIARSMIFGNYSNGRIKNATGKWYSLTEDKAYSVADIPDDCAGSYTVQIDAGAISGKISGSGVQGYDLTCDTNTGNCGNIPMTYRWQQWSGDKTTTWHDIYDDIWNDDRKAITVLESWQNDHIRCIVKPATSQYVANETTIEFDGICTRSIWTSNTAEIMNDGNNNISVNMDGLPDEEKYGKTSSTIGWFVDCGPTDNAKHDIKMYKSVGDASSRYNAFTGLNQTVVIPGQTYRLQYDSITQTYGEDIPIDILLYEWTNNPESYCVSAFGTIPYSDTAGYVDIAIPSDLKANTDYTLTIAAGFGKLIDYSAEIKGAKFDCITENGFVPINWTYGKNPFNAIEYLGHRIFAIVEPENRYYKMSRLRTDSIMIE